jgi:hypothetical protein
MKDTLIWKFILMENKIQNNYIFKFNNNMRHRHFILDLKYFGSSGLQTSIFLCV